MGFNDKTIICKSTTKLLRARESINGCIKNRLCFSSNNCPEENNLKINNFRCLIRIGSFVISLSEKKGKTLFSDIMSHEKRNLAKNR
jgi:hypothetical protein